MLCVCTHLCCQNRVAQWHQPRVGGTQFTVRCAWHFCVRARQPWLTQKSEDEVTSIMQRQSKAGDGLYIVKGSPSGTDFSLYLIAQQTLHMFAITRDDVGGRCPLRRAAALFLAALLAVVPGRRPPARRSCGAGRQP